MKKRFVLPIALALVVAMFAVGCGNNGGNTPEPAPAPVASSEAESAAPEVKVPATILNGPEVIDYTNVNYDFSADISRELDLVKTSPDASPALLSVSDNQGTSGMVLVPSVEAGNTMDIYMNALVAGNEVTIKGDIKTAESSVQGALEAVEGGVKFVPAPLKAMEANDEVINVVLNDGTVYNIHTWNQHLPNFDINVQNVAEENKGVYHFTVDKVALSVNTDGEIVYFRDFNCVGEELMAEGFAKQVTADGDFYTIFIELKPEWRNSNGGFSSGFYLLMDGNHQDFHSATQLPNEDPNHTHGEGYLDQHEFVILGKDHYLNLSYTPEYVENIPESAGTGGSYKGYVWAGVFQEVKDGKVVAEINTTDYPLLYESAVEKVDYANSTDQGCTVKVNGADKFVIADGWQDYVHPNSLDYTLKADGTVDKLLVSMRDQCAVYQFDMTTGAIEWILGGQASTLGGYEAYTSERKDEAGHTFDALMYAQHYARYMNKNEQGVIEGNAKISLFDNQTGTAPFLYTPMAPGTYGNPTRTFTAVIDTEKGTAEIDDVIEGAYLNTLTKKYHIASHCGSVEYFNENSVVIGWGLSGVLDNIGAQAPEGTFKDEAQGFTDLRQGSRPIVTEYDMANDEITFELSVTRNLPASEALFSYRTYKTAK